MLYRRIYFLFHDETSARGIVAELEKSLGLADYQIHLLRSEPGGFVTLDDATIDSKSPHALHTERFYWYLSIGVFTVALIGFVLALLAASWIWAVLLAVIVVAAQLSGYLFTNRVPSAQLDRFRSALGHGEVLMLVDVPHGHVKRVKTFVYGRYPEARTNVGNWHVGTLGI